MTDTPLVSARGLTKRFGDFVAVDGIDLDVHAGEAFGLLGPNGAGKSSTMRMIATMSPPTEGELRIFGLDPDTDGPLIRAQLGVVPQDDNLDLDLTVRDNLWIYGRYFDLPRDELRTRVDELLAFAQLTDRADSLVDPLSGGMRRRLTIARGLVNQPRLLMLDEPTTGLDPQARHLVWERLFGLRRAGTTLLLTTHYMDEAEQLCDRLIVMDRGRVVAEGSPQGLIREHATREVLELRFVDEAEHARAAGRLDGLGERIEDLPDRLLVYTADADGTLAEVHDRGVQPFSALTRRSTLEDVFLRLTGRTLVDE